MSRVGGLSVLHPPDARSSSILDSVIQQLDLGVLTSLAKVLGYHTQVVNGTNFFLKVGAGNRIIHVRAHQALDKTVTFVGKQEGKSVEEEITYF